MLTGKAGLVGLDVGFGNLAVLDDESVPDAPGAAEDVARVAEVEAEGLCQDERRIGEEADLLWEKC